MTCGQSDVFKKEEIVILKLAFRNIFGAGLRTWLNVFILSLAYFAIILMQGMFEGWQKDATIQIRQWDIGAGQFRQENYDPYDPFTIDESHAPIPEELEKDINEKNAVPILIASATVFPEGRMRRVLLKGIAPEQQLLKIPTKFQSNNSDEINVVIGSRMAKSMDLKIGDYLTIRWRDKFGTFDAVDVKIAQIFNTTVLTIDANQIWISRKNLEEMLEMENEATLIVINEKVDISEISGWKFRDLDFLLQDLNAMVQAKKVGSIFFFFILLFMAMIAIFDTQILSIFRRRKEMGTMMALGMTRQKIIRLFTLEGSLHALLAIFMGAIYGIPLLNYLSIVGIKIGMSAEDFGLSGITDSLYPQYGWKLVVGTIVIVLFTTTIVSYLPTRKIAKLKPTDALRGKMTK